MTQHTSTPWSKDGGPAFPNPAQGPMGSSGQAPSGDGMTLRDYFAAKAMQGFIAAGCDWWPDKTGHDWSRNAAKGAYEIADHMLSARAAKATAP